MKNSESEEMYLETILVLLQKRGEVRSVDVAEELCYARSSVSRGVGLLEKRGFIKMDEHGRITLTESGRAKSQSVYEKHTVLTRAFILMGAEKKSAEENACRIEHIISDDLFAVIKAHVELHAPKDGEKNVRNGEQN